MSVDLAGIRGQIAAVLGTIPTFNGHVDPYERRDRTTSEMPLAQVWRDTATEPDVNQPQPEFGSYGYSFTWKLRCYIPMDDDAASQVLADSLTLALFAAFNDPANALAASGLVDEWRLESVEPIPVLDIERPVFLLEGTLKTQAHG